MRGVKCKNCAILKNWWCDKVVDSPDPEIVRDCQYFRQITEYDHICAMSEEKMAEFLFGILRNCEECFLFRKGACDGTAPCYETILKWLRSAREC